MADISEYIQEIEYAARGEEVRDSIVDALEAMNNGINYIEYIDVIVTSTTENNTVYQGGYKYEIAFEGATANMYVEPCLTDLNAYHGRYAAESLNDKIILHFDTQPVANLPMRVYYFAEGDMEDAESYSY